jgi:hypothetical protein
MEKNLLTGHVEFEQRVAASFPEPQMENAAQRHQYLEVPSHGHLAITPAVIYRNISEQA